MKTKKVILLVAMGLSFAAIGQNSKLEGNNITIYKDSIEIKENTPISTSTLTSEEKISLKKQRKVIRPTTTWSKIKDLFM